MRSGMIGAEGCGESDDDDTEEGNAKGFEVDEDAWAEGMR